MYGELENCKCAVCGANSNKQVDYNDMFVFYICPVCGRYEIHYDLSANEMPFNLNQLSSYLVYNRFRWSENEYRYYTNRDKEWCDEWSKKCKEDNIRHGHPVFLSEENIKNWYPKTFAEKIDKILLFLNKQIPYIGDDAILKTQEIYSAFFVDRYDYSTGKRTGRDSNAQLKQANYMLDYLIDKKYINANGWNEDDHVVLSLLPAGYSRIDELQKNTADGRNVLVAMKFGEDTKVLREAIRYGISNAGYIPIFIDEVQHNDFITPELLKHIKNSKFVVVDLTHQNNGAYFEEGYAMGIGKPVIQLCRKDVTLHFDIAQKNTIMWDTESDIPQRLTNRIIATID